jgi:hypothetical protein
MRNNDRVRTTPFDKGDVAQAAAAEISSCHASAVSFTRVASHWSIMLRLNQTFAQGKGDPSALCLAAVVPV